MNFAISHLSDAQEVKQLFTQVFSDSEGAEEGALIGNLAHELQEATAPDDIVSFIAKDAGSMVGSIIFTRMTFESPVNAFILSPVAVASCYQKQGVGQKLIRFGLEYLKQQGVELVLTYGDPNFYSKVGFQQISETLIKAPLKLSYPEGWLAQSLTGEEVEAIAGESGCVQALNQQRYW